MECYDLTSHLRQKRSKQRWAQPAGYTLSYLMKSIPSARRESLCMNGYHLTLASPYLSVQYPMIIILYQIGILLLEIQENLLLLMILSKWLLYLEIPILMCRLPVVKWCVCVRVCR